MCEDCIARQKMLREALIQGKIRESLQQAAIGAVEAVGLKRKTGVNELAQKPNSGAAG